MRSGGAQRGGARQDACVGDRDVDPPEAIDDIGDGEVECGTHPYVGDRAHG